MYEEVATSGDKHFKNNNLIEMIRTGSDSYQNGIFLI